MIEVLPSFIRTNSRILRLLAFGLLALLSGCLVGPDYRKPNIDMPASWRIEEGQLGETANTAWWEQFQDPVLNELIRSALEQNRDLRIATARIEQFYGQYRTTRSAMLPEVGFDASAERQRTTEHGFVPIPQGTSPSYNTFKAELGFNWELDVWGRLRRATEAAQADLLGAEETRQAVILTLVSSVANAYINLRSLDRQLEIAEKTAKSYEETMNLFTLQFQYGAISELDLSQAKSQYYSALAAIPAFEKMINQQENGLSILLGRNPGPIARGKPIDQLVLPPVPAGLPSDLLARRPDIRQAEQQLIAANARIGVARGLYFPSISLTALFGVSSTELSNLFSGPSREWNFTGSILGPIFSTDRIRGQVRTAEAAEQEMLFTYQKTIQAGFQEMNDALVDQDRTRVQRDAQASQVDALRTYERLALDRYTNGYSRYIEVLDARTRLFAAELSYTQTLANLFHSLVNVYKAMGGGWVIAADQIATHPQEVAAPPQTPAKK